MLVNKSDGKFIAQLTSPFTLKEVCELIVAAESPIRNFSVISLSNLKESLDLWNQYLPMIRPFYAVKCNPNLGILRELAKFGLGFDCASDTEVNKVVQLGINPAEDIIFAQTVKRRVDLEAIAEAGIKYATFDCVGELEKICEYGLDLEMLLRIKVDSSSCLYKFYGKFGAETEEYADLFKAARRLGVKIVGVCFHVGSGVTDATDYYRAIEEAKKAFYQGEIAGFSLTILDIGGGFLRTNIEKAANKIKRGLEDFFGTTSVKIISEPGQFFALTAQTYAVFVSGKRSRVRDGERRIEYTLSDGIYGMFSLASSYGIEFFPQALGPSKSSLKFPTVFYGPTCSGDDVIMRTSFEELEVGDWIAFENIGAYTNPLCTDFNGFQPEDHQKYYISADLMQLKA